MDGSSASSGYALTELGAGGWGLGARENRFPSPQPLIPPQPLAPSPPSPVSKHHHGSRRQPHAEQLLALVEIRRKHAEYYGPGAGRPRHAPGPPGQRHR